MSSGIKINSIGAVSGTMETRSMQPMYPTKNAATIVPNSAPRSALNGRQSLNISINPTANATMTESVETCGFVKFSGPLNSVNSWLKFMRIPHFPADDGVALRGT